MSIIVADKKVVLARLSGAGFLRQQAPAPYTSLVVKRTGAILSWNLHLERLVNSVELLQAQGIFQDWPIHAREDSRQLIKSLVIPTLQRAVEVLYIGDESSCTDISAVVLLATESGEAKALVHASTFVWPASTLGQPRDAVLHLTGPRDLAAAKHSQWAYDRLRLESATPSGAEGVLCSADGRLLEGFVSNLFVVTEDGVVQTAHPNSDQVLDGIMRRMVIRACHALGWTVVEQAPCLGDRDTWQEVFFTNCRRMIQPVSTMTLAKRKDESHEWPCRFVTPGSNAQQLYQAVHEACDADAHYLSVR